MRCQERLAPKKREGVTSVHRSSLHSFDLNTHKVSISIIKMQTSVSQLTFRQLRQPPSHRPVGLISAAATDRIQPTGGSSNTAISFTTMSSQLSVIGFTLGEAFMTGAIRGGRLLMLNSWVVRVVMGVTGVIGMIRLATGHRRR